jgi:predicted nucleic acid-binding protein
MTRFAIDALSAVRLAREKLAVPEENKLVAASQLRSQALSLIYREVRRGELTAREAYAMLDRITAMRIRLLGDRVSRATAWKVAEQLGWDDTAAAEYVAVAQLQADAFVTLDADLADAVAGLGRVVPLEALLRVE